MKRDPSGYWAALGIKGEAAGHPFRGNQYTSGVGSDQEEKPPVYTPAELDRELNAYDHLANLQHDEGEVRKNLGSEYIPQHDEIRKKVYEFASNQKEHGANEIGFLMIGGEVIQQEGNEGFVRTPKEYLDRMEHIVHSHPSGTTLSASDIANMWHRKNQRSIEAVSPNGTIYRLERLRGAGKIEERKATTFRNLYNRLRDKAVKQYDEGDLIQRRNKSADNKGTPRYVWEMDQVLRKMAAKYPKDIRYTVTKIGKSAQAKSFHALIPEEEGDDEFYVTEEELQREMEIDPSIEDDRPLADPFGHYAPFKK